jgi:hypothetical protein
MGWHKVLGAVTFIIGIKAFIGTLKTQKTRLGPPAVGTIESGATPPPA